MYKISDEQIDFILNDIRARGVEMESLQDDLLDHVCCIIEQNLEEGGSFRDFYQNTIQTFYKEELWEIEEETINLLTFKNYYLMKKIMILSGASAAALMSLGILFKFMHWPAASLLIVLGILFSSLVFLPLLLTLKIKEQQKVKDKVVVGLAVLSGILVSLSVLFKVMRWPGANMMGVLFLILLLAVYLPFYFFSGIKNPDTKVNTITTSILIIMGGGLFLTLLNSKPSIQIRAAAVTNNYFLKSYEAISKQSHELYAVAQKDSSGKLSTLQSKAENICKKIEDLKLQLVNATDQAQYDHVDYDQIQKLDNYDLPTLVLFGNDTDAEKPLLELKHELEELNAFCNETFKFNSNGILGITDSDQNIADGKVTWEMNQFYHTPLNNVLRNLTQLQLNIRYVETGCLKQSI